MQTVTVDFIFQIMLIFARCGTMIHFVPGIGDKYVPSRIRLALGLTISLIFYPLVQANAPHYPMSPGALAECMASEMLIGALLGLTVKILFLSLHVVGSVIAMQSGLGAATFFDLSQREQITIFSSFLLLAGTMMIFATDTHHLFIQGVLQSYEYFPLGKMPSVADASDFISQVVNNSFIVSFKMMSPFLIVSVAILVGGGVLARLMPSLQVFFVLTPVQICAMFITLFLVFQAMMDSAILVIQDAAKMYGII